MRPTTFFFEVDMLRPGEEGARAHGEPARTTGTVRVSGPRRCVLPGGGTVIFRVRARESALREQLAFLLKVRYIIEHFSLYNVRDLHEHSRVSVTLSCARSDWILSHGLSRKLSVLGAAKRSPAFLNLEEEVLHFLMRFRDFWDRRLRALAAAHSLPGAAAASEEGSSSAAPLPPDVVLEGLPPGAAFAGLPVDAEHAELWFTYRFLTDEFVFYGIQGSAAMSVVLQLAALCYSTLFQHEVFCMHRVPQHKPQALGPRDRTRGGAVGAGGQAILAPLPRELAPWVKQLSYFLSYFPDKLAGVTLMHELQALRDTLRRRLQHLRERPLTAHDGAGGRGGFDSSNWSEEPDGAGRGPHQARKAAADSGSS